jgi:hypothetical protein
VGVVESVAAAIVDDRRRSGGSDGIVRRRLPQLQVSGVGGDGGPRSDTWRRLMGRTRGPKIRGVLPQIKIKVLHALNPLFCSIQKVSSNKRIVDMSFFIHLKINGGNNLNTDRILY